MTEERVIYPFTNDEIFKVVMQDEDIAKELVCVILNRKVVKIQNHATQKDKKVSKLARGVRFDLYFEDDDAVYEVEMQNSSVFNIGKRCRYYQSMIDVDLLKQSQSYSSLKDSYIIFLCTYDPFKLDKPIYTFEMVCTDDPKCPVEETLKLEMGAKVVVCNARAYEKSTDKLHDLLAYLSNREVAKDNELIEKIDEAVQIANGNEKIREEAMISEIKIQDAREEAREAEQKRVIQILELDKIGLTNEQKEMLIKELMLKKSTSN